MSDKHSQQNALRAQRAYEAYEREWRRKEKEAAEKHAAQEKELREERIKQQEAREYAIAVEAHKMRQEFYENLARQKALEEKIKKEGIIPILKGNNQPPIKKRESIELISIILLYSARKNKAKAIEAYSTL